jgi:imidazole glycerol-phosphate synthase subunit HisF
MLKTRVIPTLLWKDFGLVKGVGFDSWRRVGSVMPAIKVYQLRDVDELILMDITAFNEDRELDYDAVEDLAKECRVPLTVGGGVKNLSMIRRLLQSGADKVAINSAAYDNIDLISEAAATFGSQCIVASIDARKPSGKNFAYECVRRSGTEPTGREVAAWAKELQQAGAGEILITSIENDGTLNGYDLELIRTVTEAVSIPTIASGGAGCIDHFYDAIQLGNASAVAAASIFHFTEHTPAEIKRALGKRGIPVRNHAARKPAQLSTNSF